MLAGEVELAARFLGAPFQLRGEVVHGDQAGPQLGSRPRTWSRRGARVPGPRDLRGPRRRRCAAVSVGVRPTFGTGRAVLVEAYLLDRDVDLYGQVLTVDFLARLRGERRFDPSRRSSSRCTRDVRRTRELCGGRLLC